MIADDVAMPLQFGGFEDTRLLPVTCLKNLRRLDCSPTMVDFSDTHQRLGHLVLRMYECRKPGQPKKWINSLVAAMINSRFPALRKITLRGILGQWGERPDLSTVAADCGLVHVCQRTGIRLTIQNVPPVSAHDKMTLIYMEQPGNTT